MPLRINGATSGYVQLAAPNAAGSTALVLPTDSVQPGLVLVAESSFTTAATVSVNNCFTATYDGYRVVIAGLALTTSTATLGMRMRVGGADSSAASYWWAQVRGVSSAASPASAGANSSTSWTIADLGTTPSIAAIDVTNPALSKETQFTGLSTALQTNYYIEAYGGVFNATTVFDGFTLIPSASTISGSLKVYGYRNSITT